MLALKTDTGLIWENGIFQVDASQNIASIDILISDKLHFKPKSITRESHCIMNTVANNSRRYKNH